MAYDIKLADRVRESLANFSTLKIEEKKMFGGLAFLACGKMCINVSGDKLMCRFDPLLQEEVAEKQGYQPMKMKEKIYKGYCYVNPEGLRDDQNFKYWISLCLEFNNKAKSSNNRKL